MLGVDEPTHRLREDRWRSGTRPIFWQPSAPDESPIREETRHVGDIGLVEGSQRGSRHRTVLPDRERTWRYVSAMRFGLCFHCTFPASEVIDFARDVESGGLDEIWVIEDCFYTSGPSLAAAALTATARLSVGIGILPAVVRHPAVTAMELATLAALGPGRFTAGIGHGVQTWMAQMGLRPASPITALDETMTVVRRLLDGEEVTMEGETILLESVALDAPPAARLPLLAGVRGPKSMALAGRVADGVILAEPVPPAYIHWAREQAGRGHDFEVVAFAPWIVLDDAARARSFMVPLLAAGLETPNQGHRSLPFFDDLLDRHRDGGEEALGDMPDDWWWELGPIGSITDAHEHLDRMEAAGTDRISFFPAPVPDLARGDLATMSAVVSARRR